MNGKDRLALQGVVDEINEFDDKTEEEEYTDTGEAWELLNRIKSTLRGLIKKKGKKR
jgi:hypothetical protein